MMNNLIHDLRYATRQLRKNAGFTAVSLLTLTLGIGASTAIFSVVHAVLLKPLAYRDPDRVVLLTEGATPERFEEIAASSHSYEAVGAFASGVENVSLTGSGEPAVIKTARVSSNFLHILGVSPLLGRSFLPDEDGPGAAPVAMIGAELWKQRFNEDRAIVGQAISLAGIPHTVIGVLPKGFQFPIAGSQIWVTKPTEWSTVTPQGRSLSPILSIFGRLRPQVGLRQATAELTVLNRRYAAAHPEMLDIRPASPDVVQPYKESIVSDVRPELWMLFGAISLVLLIVCANIAGLQLARASSRSREFAVRTAIGAGRGRIIRQLLTESLLIAMTGGALGVAFAAWSLGAIRRMTFVDLPRAAEIQLNGTVLAFAIAISVLTGVLFGLLPAFVASRPDLASVLKGSGESSTQSPAKGLKFGPRGLLVVGQIALSIVLLIGATLLIESLARVYRVDPGFQPSHLLTMNIALSSARYHSDEKRAAFYSALVTRAQSVPGVRSAAVTLNLPMSDSWIGQPVQAAGTALLPLNQRLISITQDISPDFFGTMGIPLQRGRQFTNQDNAKSIPVAIVNENLARLFWPEYPAGPNPIGKRIVVGNNPEEVEIVGIAANVRQWSRDEDPKANVYFPCAQKSSLSAMLAVRTQGDPLSFATAIRAQILAIDPEQPVSGVASMNELVANSEGQLRLMMTLLGTFAASAALLAVLGLYGVISYSVVRRTREIGIRRALGAQRHDILSSMGRQVIGLALAGALIGVGGAFALTRLLQDLLYRVSATDPATFAGIPIAFLLVALAASYLPARRATRVDPMVALRYE